MNMEHKIREAVTLIREGLKMSQRPVIYASFGKDSVHEDSSIWVKLNGVAKKTTPKELLTQINGEIHRLPDGRVILTPFEKLEILTASTRTIADAEPIFGRVSRLMYHTLSHRGDLFRVKLRAGNEITVTGDHGLMVETSGYKGSIVKEKACRDIKPGDTLWSVADLGFETPEVEVSDILLRLCGLWVADGCFVNNKGTDLGKLIISTGNNQAVIRFLSGIPCSDLNKNYRLKSGRLIHCSVKANGDAWLCNRDLVNQMKALGFTGKCKEKRIPEWLFTASRRQVGIFLAGYFDGDGCVHPRGISCSGVNREMLQGVRSLLKRLGVDSGWSSTKSVGGFSTQNKELFTIGVVRQDSLDKFLHWIPIFKSSETINRITTTDVSTRPFRRRQIMAVERVAASGVTVFDFEVNDNQMFIANDVLAHNSMVLLHLITRYLGLKMDLVFHREPFQTHKYRFAEGVIIDWNLTAYDWPPIASRMWLGKNILAYTRFYRIGKKADGMAATLALPKNILDPESGERWVCGKEHFLERPTAEVVEYPWDCAFIGHKDCDEDQIAGKVPLHRSIVVTDGGPLLVFPLRSWSHDEVWDYIDLFNLPVDTHRYDRATRQEWPKKTFNSDYFHACTNCIDIRKSGKVFCPLVNKEIESEADERDYVEVKLSYYGEKEETTETAA